MRLEHFLRAHAQRHGAKAALVTAGRRIGYADLHERVNALALGLRRLGVAAGDRVLVYLPNGVEFVQSLYAGFALGAIVVPVNTRMTPNELAYFAADSRPSVFIHHAESTAALREIDAALAGVRRVVVGPPDAALPDAALPDAALPYAASLRFNAVAIACDETLPDVPMAAEDCMILYTSGTTGKPKGAVMTHANMIVQHGFINAVDWRITADDVFLVTTPLAHRTGMARMLNSMCLGGTLVAMERFDGDAAVALIEAEQVSAIGMVPTVARLLMPALERGAARCASLRHLIVTGEAFPVELKRRLIELLPQVRQHSFFAMTEVGSVTGLEHAEQFTHPSSVGRVTPGVEVKLVDERGHEVSVGEAGELLVRAGIPGRFTTMRGYFERPAETAATIVDGWVRTGDMARFDVDGYLYIVDRKKDMVLSGGFNIYTKEVEQMLLEHAAIADAAVVGVPDEVFGEAVAAFIELKPGLALDLEQVLAHSKARIACYKKPRHVFFVEAFPRNAMGKVLKTELRTRALDALRIAGAAQTHEVTQ
jgi:long-chain acyl-CoA synthetase